MLKNKYFEDFWNKKDPSKIQVQAKLIDQLGYEVEVNDLNNKKANIIETNNNY